MRKTCLMLSICFSIFIPLPMYVFLILYSRDRANEILDIFLKYIILGISPAFLVGYFFVYNSRKLEKKISDRIPFVRILLYQLIANCLCSALIWGVPSGIAFGFYEPYGTMTWVFLTIIGVIPGLIFGLISTIIIAILVRKHKDRFPQSS